MSIWITENSEGRDFIKGDTFKEQYQVNKYYYPINFKQLKVDERAVFSAFPKFMTLTSTTIQMFSRNILKFYNVGELGITDGYWLTLLSPLVLIYWILISLLIVPVYVIFGIITVMAFVWGIAFELPADALNNRKIDKLAADYMLEHPDLVEKEEDKNKNI
jgi:hypothetical protein